MKRSMLALSALILVAFSVSGCLWRPFSGQENATSSGCAYSNPACGSDYSCINNTCVLKQGCGYSNPQCDANQTCVNNTCVETVTPSGCAYSNPACGSDYDCMNNSCLEKTICGKFGCQQGETQEGCCEDCGCPSGESCLSGTGCVSSGAHISLESADVEPISSTLLYAVPPKTIEKGRGPLARLLFRNTGSIRAFNIKLKTEVVGYTGGIVSDLGALQPGASLQFNMTPLFSDKVILVSAKSNATLRLDLEYRGGNDSYTDTANVNLPLLGRNSADWSVPESLAAWMNPADLSVSDFAQDATDHAIGITTDEQKERAARQIFGSMQARSIQYAAGNGTADHPGACYSDTLAFPSETLQNRSGDCADLALLFASSLEAVSMKSVLIITPDDLLAGYIREDKSIAPIDLRYIDSTTFPNASAAGLAEYSADPASNIIIYPEDQWGLGMRKVNPGVAVPSSDIRTLSANCYLVPGKLNVNYWFQNDGFDTGRRCVNATLYDSGDTYWSRRDCVDIALGDKRNVTFTESVPTNLTLNAKCWLD